MSIKADKLYGFLLKNPDRWVSQEEICANLPDYFKYTEPKNGTTINRNIWKTVNEINFSLTDYTLVILTDKRSYKFATREEGKKFLKKEWKKWVKKVKRLKQIEYKLKLDGVADLTSLLSSDQLEFLNTTIKENNDEK